MGLIVLRQAAMRETVKEESVVIEPAIDLDPRELLGLSQVAKVSGKPEAVGRLLCKVGTEGSPPPTIPLVARLLSKIGDEGAEIAIPIEQ